MMRLWCFSSLLMCLSAFAQTTIEPDGTVDQDDPLARVAGPRPMAPESMHCVSWTA